MCEFCKDIVNNTESNNKSVSMALRENATKTHGLQLFIGKSNGKFKIEDYKFIRDETVKEPLRYLKAVKWQKGPKPLSWTTAIEIHYCPVCGEKL